MNYNNTQEEIGFIFHDEENINIGKPMVNFQNTTFLQGQLEFDDFSHRLLNRSRNSKQNDSFGKVILCTIIFVIYYCLGLIVP